MSLNDPFFDAWVRDKLLHTEARTPEHLWDKIRKRSRGYVVMERNKYLLILLLLLGVTTGTGYWAFHSLKEKAPGSSALTSASAPAAADAGTLAGALATTGHPRLPGGTVSSKTTSVPAPTAAETTTGNVETTTGIAETTSADVQTTPGNAETIETPSDGAALKGAATTTPDITLNKANDNLDEKNDIQALAAFPLTPADPAKTPLTSPANTKGNTKVNTNTLIHVNTPRHTYFEIYAGPDHVKHYITTSNKAYEGYIAQVRAVESSYPSFSVGLRLDMPLLSNDWRLQLGVHYAQINERMSYANFDAIKTLTEITEHAVLQPNGSSVLVRDTSTVSVKGQFLKQSLNAYRMIDIPVMVSRTLFKTGQVQVNGSGGALFNVTSWYNGDVLDTNDVPVALGTKATQGVSAWKKHIGTSLYGSLSLYDQVFKHVQATFEPYLRYDLSPVNKDQSIYKERFVTTGLMVGIRYQLGK